MRMRGVALLAAGSAAVALLYGGVHAAQDPELPDGPGKEIVAERCGLCHALRYARINDYSPEGWRVLLAQMRNIGLPLTDEEFETVADYLIDINPERERAPAKILAGPLRVTFKDWPVATEGVLPRDAALGPDGSIWFSGQFANLLIRLDPWAGTLTEHRLRMPYSAPMGIAVDRGGDVWFAANRRAYVGRFNRRTNTVREYRMPNETPPDPSGLALARNGIVWFTAQRGNLVGRLDPASGDLTFIPVPPATTPFAIAVDSTGAPFVGLRDGHTILRIDPESFTRREYTLADPESEPRRIAISGDGMIWYTDIDRGMLGRLDPESGAVKEYTSPSGPTSAPHGLTVTGNTVWYVESKTLPNTLVHFDPARESFQSWAIPAGYALVRDIAVTQDGNLAFAMGSANSIGLATVGR